MSQENELIDDDILDDDVVDTSADAAGDNSNDEADERVTQSAESHNDEQGHDGETAEEAEERKKRNRERRLQNKERRKDYLDSLKREIAARDELLNDALTRLQAVERRTHSGDIAAVDNEIKKTADAYGYFKGQIDLAVREQDGAAVAEATEKMFQAQRRLEQLNGVKQAVSKQQSAPPPLDPRLKNNAESWLSRNAWYDPMARDEDSYLVKQLDQRLAEEGWNPTTEQYWAELDARVKRYLPHRAKSGYTNTQADPKTRPRAPVAGSGRDSAGSSSQGSYKLSADRVNALKDAGIWDDPKQRASAIERYKEFDRAAARN